MWRESLMSLKKEIEDILHPPRAPIISEETVIVCKPQMDRSQLKVDPAASKPIIDFSYINWSYLANNSSFQRGVMEFIKKIVPGLENIEVRGSKDAMAKSFSQEKKNYINVMSEFKSKLEKIKND